MPITVKEIIFKWIANSLQIQSKLNFSAHYFQNSLPQIGKTYFNQLHTPDLYSREWRKIREGTEYDKESDSSKIEINGFLIEEYWKKGSRQKWYRVSKTK